MKLYLLTEKQLRNAIISWSDCSMQDVIDRLTPIELPSDEEIENIMISKYPHSVGVGIDHLIKSDERIGFEEGAKWMKEQILNQNK